MTKMYQVAVYPTMTVSGVWVSEKHGTLYELDGGRQTVIDTHGGQPADGWHKSRRDAYLEASEKVQAYATRLANQAAYLREEATK